MLHAAIIGVTGYGRQHLALLAAAHDAGRVRLARATVVNPAEASAEVAEVRSRGGQVFDDWRAMLDAPGPLDLVLIPTPIHLHAEMTVAALRRGAHVLVEKPLAGSVAEVEAMIAAANLAGRFVGVGFQEASNPVWQEVRAWIAAGRFGRLRSLRGYGLWPRTSAYYGRNRWVGRKLLDGAPVFDSPFNNALAHFIHVLLSLAGADRDASLASIEGELLRAQAIENFDTGCFRARTLGGVEIVFAATHSCGPTVNPAIRIEGERGHIVWRFGEGVVECTLPGAPFPDLIDDNADKRRHLFDALLARVEGRQDGGPICDLVSAASHVRLIERLQREVAVRDVHPSRIIVEPQPDGLSQTCVVGVEAAIEATFATGRLFLEQGVDLAAPSSAAIPARA